MDAFCVQVYDTLHTSENWLAIGAMILLGHFGGQLANRVRLPSIVGYLLVGVAVGGSGLNLISFDQVEGLALVSDFGLAIVAFMIGTELSARLFKHMGRSLVAIILAESFGAFFLVMGGVYALCWLHPLAGVAGIAAALVFAAMAPASAPAGTVAVIQQYNAKGPLTSLLLAVVGLDDALAIMIYAFAIAGARVALGEQGAGIAAKLVGPVIEIVGGILLGVLVGGFLLWVADKTKTRNHVLTITMGAILLTTGLANALHLSLILANLVVGCVLANLSKHHTERTYAAVQQITHVVFVLFFVLAGAHLNFHVLSRSSLIVPVYIVGRSLGLVGGAYFGASITHADEKVRRYLGLGILSQAGVAIGLALVTAKEFGGADSPFGDAGRSLAAMTINTVAATTIFFEILGPITTKIAISKAGEIGKADEA